MDAETLRKRVERYRQLLAEKTKGGAPRERVRLFRKKVKRFQRRLRKVARASAAAEKAASSQAQAPAAKAN